MYLLGLYCYFFCSFPRHFIFYIPNRKKQKQAFSQLFTVIKIFPIISMPKSHECVTRLNIIAKGTLQRKLSWTVGNKNNQQFFITVTKYLRSSAKSFFKKILFELMVLEDSSPNSLVLLPQVSGKKVGRYGILGESCLPPGVQEDKRKIIIIFDTCIFFGVSPQ